jgi:uncharacterized membrane protein YbhN (UPF0104 family)
MIAERLGIKIGFLAAWQNVYIGQFFNQVFPSSLGGDAVRVWRLTTYKVSPKGALASIVLERIVALAAIPFIALGGIVVFLHVGHAHLAIGLTVLIGAAALGIAMLLCLDRLPLPAALTKLGTTKVLEEISAASKRVFLSWDCISRTMLLSLLIHAGVGTSFWLLAASLDFSAPLVQFLVLTPIILLVTALPISLGGWGLREGATVGALALIGAPTSTALMISILFGLVMIVVGLPGGVMWLLDTDRRLALKTPA